MGPKLKGCLQTLLANQSPKYDWLLERVHEVCWEMRGNPLAWGKNRLCRQINLCLNPDMGNIRGE